MDRKQRDEAAAGKSQREGPPGQERKVAWTSIRSGSGTITQRPLPFLLVTLVPAAGAWWLIYLGSQAFGGLGGLSAKALASVMAFIVWPLLMLWVSGRPLELGRLDRGFGWGLVLYLTITAVLLAFYPGNPDFFHDLLGSPRWLYLLKVAPVVMAVDLLTKRFIQREVAAAHGDDAGEAAQALAWFFGHALELVWLQPLLGLWGTVLFMAGTGLATGRLYRRTGNVAGMMVGHWMVSLMVVLVVSA